MRIAMTLAAVAATVVLSGCSSGGEDTANEAASSTTSPSSSSAAASSTASSPTAFPADQLPRAEVERVFISNLEDSGFIPRYGDAEDSLELADLVCVHFNRGGTMADLLATVMPGATMTESEFRGFAAVAAVAFCPEHVNDIVTG